LTVFNCFEDVIGKDEVIGIYSGILSRALDQEDMKTHSKYALRLDTRLYVEGDPDIIDKMADKGSIRRSTAEILNGAYTTRINMLLTPKARHNVKFVNNGLGLMKVIADIALGEELSVDYGPEHDWSRERGELMECCASIWRSCRKLEITFPTPPANEDKQQRSRRSVLAHSALFDEASTPTQRQAMVSIAPSFVD
jgi:hypothetical protein